MKEEFKKEWSKLTPEVKTSILKEVRDLSSNPFGSSGYWSDLNEYFELVYINK